MIKGIDYPEWLTEEGLTTLKRQHLLPGETPNQMYSRVVNSLASYLKLNNEEIEVIKSKWLSYLHKGWLCLATPVAANTGTQRGLPISCYVLRVPDSLEGIYDKAKEMALLTKMGGGVGVTLDKIRGSGSPISTGGFSSGIPPFAKVYESSILAANQGGVRRGAASLNLPIRHKDIKWFLNMRKSKGDMNRQCPAINHCVTIDDYFMQDIENGNAEARELWAELLSVRMSTGQPYIFFYHNVNNNRPKVFKDKNLKIDGTNICCLAGDTEVITKEGIYKIKDLVGKEVTIYDGKNWVKCDNFKEYNEDELWEITLKNGQKLKANADHRWFVANTYENIRDKRYKTTKTIELKEGQWLEDSIKQAEYHGDKTMKGAYLKGFLIADGTSDENEPILNLHFTKYQCANKLIESYLEIDNGVKNTNAIDTVSFSDEIINPNQLGKQRFKRMRGLTIKKDDLINFASIYKKELPDFRDLDKESKIEFLSGLLDGDGTYTTSGIQISSIHLEFIKELQKLIFSFGYNASIDVCDFKDRNSIYRLTIGSYDSYQLIQELKCVRLEIPEIEPNRRTTGHRQIVKIEKLNYKEKVYCPQIPTTKKFLLANGVLTGNTEILLPHHYDLTVVCCLSSVNLAKWDEFKDDNEFIINSLLFLDCVISEFIDRAKAYPGTQNAIRFAEKSRSIGLGVLGFHTYLQENNIPFASITARSIATKISKYFKEQGVLYQEKYSKLLGEPEWCKGYNMRNSTLFAIAPTTTNALISGGVSQGIEPIVSNAYAQQSAKGTFIRKNPTFQKLIETKYPQYNTPEMWKSVELAKGSVQHLEFLDNETKEVFLTAYEINQLELIKLGAIWNNMTDQGVSLNLFFPHDVNPKWLNNCHLEAWRLGIKTLYYVRTESIASRLMSDKTFSNCLMCEG